MESASPRPGIVVAVLACLVGMLVGSAVTYAVIQRSVSFPTSGLVVGLGIGVCAGVVPVQQTPVAWQLNRSVTQDRENKYPKIEGYDKQGYPGEARKWSLILLWLDFANGVFFERLVREGCDAVCWFRPAFLVGQDCHGVHVCEACGDVYPHLGGASAALVLHHGLQLCGFEAVQNFF